MITEQNAVEGPGLLRGLLEVPGSGKFIFLSEVLGFKSLAPKLPEPRGQNKSYVQLEGT